MGHHTTTMRPSRSLAARFVPRAPAADVASVALLGVNADSHIKKK